MNTTMTALDILLMASIFLPVLLLNNIGNSNKRKLYRQFKAIATKNGLKITNKDFWANSYIGMDSKKKILLFVRMEDDSLIEELVDLNSVKDCKVTSSVKSVKNKTLKQQILLKVDLEIYFKESGTPMKLLSFYDHNRVYSEDFELKRAQNWNKLIQEHMSSLEATAMTV